MSTRRSPAPAPASAPLASSTGAARTLLAATFAFASIACLAPAIAAAPELVTDRTTASQQAADATLLKNLNRDDFTAGRFDGQGGTLPYRLLPPRSVEHGRRYPLILVLHGSDGVGDDNLGQLGRLVMSWDAPAIRDRYPAYILAPQFPERSANYTPSPLDGLLAGRPGPNIPTLIALVEQLRKQYPIDADRIYVTGFSMGASAATQALLRQPGLFAAAVAFSGIPPERDTAARLGATPLLIVHGDADTENPIEPDRAMLAALLRLPDGGGTRVRYLEYRGMEHRVPADMLLSTAWRDWLLAQRAGHDGLPR